MPKKKNLRPGPAPARLELAPPAPPQIITSLAQLEAVHIRAVTVLVMVAGQPMTLTGRRLTPAETEPVTAWLQRGQPHRLPGEKPGDPDRFDLTDPEFPARKEKALRMARALALWCAFPIFAETARAEGRMVSSQEEIRGFIEGRQLPDDLLSALFEALQRDDVKALVGFTFGSGSLTS